MSCTLRAAAPVVAGGVDPGGARVSLRRWPFLAGVTAPGYNRSPARAGEWSAPSAPKCMIRSRYVCSRNVTTAELKRLKTGAAGAACHSVRRGEVQTQDRWPGEWFPPRALKVLAGLNFFVAKSGAKSYSHFCGYGNYEDLHLTLKQRRRRLFTPHRCCARRVRSRCGVAKSSAAQC